MTTPDVTTPDVTVVKRLLVKCDIIMVMLLMTHKKMIEQEIYNIASIQSYLHLCIYIVYVLFTEPILILALQTAGRDSVTDNFQIYKFHFYKIYAFPVITPVQCYH